jgi:predicted Zn-dependent protease
MTTKKSRRQMLEAFVAANPGDAFARYGLALECVNTGDPTAAIGHFQELLAANASYVAGYQQYAQLLARLGRTAEARTVFASGITAALKAGNTHAAAEMEEALASLKA